MIQGRVNRKDLGREAGRGQWGGETGIGRRERLRWGDREGGNGEEGKVEKSWQGPVGRKGGGGRVDKEWGGEWEAGLGQWGGDWGGAMGRGRWRGAT